MARPRIPQACIHFSGFSAFRVSLPGAWKISLQAAVFLLAISLNPTGVSGAQGDPEAGRKIYLEGILPSGEKLVPALAGMAPGAAAPGQFHCSSCHRPSGFGSTEGSALVPAITGPYIYNPRILRRADLFRSLYQQVQSKSVQGQVRAPRIRPAYTDQTLADAIREGRDPTGRELDPLMPRYPLSNADMDHLIAYIKSLHATDSPGVDQTHIHFATVIMPAVDPTERKAMLDVMEGFVRWKNSVTEALLQRPDHSPYHRADFYETFRKWVLHVWELEGPPETWGQQLETHYARQPVFAFLSGLGAGSWEPVHDFCERNEIPSVFPNTDLPVVSPAFYGLYFSQGLTLQGKALARYFIDQAGGSETAVYQVFRAGSPGGVPALALREELEKAGIGVQQQRLETTGPLPPEYWQELFERAPLNVVLWLEAADLESLWSLPEPDGGGRRIYLSYSLLGEQLPDVSGRPDGSIHLTYPYTLAESSIPLIHRVRAWLRSRRIPRNHERLQLKTYLAVSVADFALGHMVDHFSRDYFIERIEEETENSLNPGVFPYLSLGPGQRFASKGCYVVRLSGPGELTAVSEWIVPE